MAIIFQLGRPYVVYTRHDENQFPSFGDRLCFCFRALITTPECSSDVSHLFLGFKRSVTFFVHFLTILLYDHYKCMILIYIAVVNNTLKVWWRFLLVCSFMNCEIMCRPEQWPKFSCIWKAPLENTEVVLRCGEAAQCFNHLAVRSVVGLEKSNLNVYSSLSAPTYFNSHKRFPRLPLTFRNTAMLAFSPEGGIWLTWASMSVCCTPM